MYFVGTVCLLICFMLVGTRADQSFRNKNLAKGCVKKSSFVTLPDVEVYYSYYACNGTQDFDIQSKSTIIFVGTPEISGSGYYEYNIFRDLPSMGASLMLQKFNLVFIDMPGVGYSRIINESYFHSIGESLHSDIASVIMKILNDHDKILGADFYLYAESWGTQILPSVALELSYDIGVEKLSKFQGIFLGSPFVSPKQQIMSWPDHLFSQGFIDVSGHSELQKRISRIIKTTDYEDRKVATRLYKKLEESIHEITFGVNQCDLSDEICMDDLQLQGRSFSPDEMKDVKTLINCRNNDRYYKKYLKEFMNRHKPKGWNHKWSSQVIHVIEELGVDLMENHNYDVVAVLDNLNINVFIISGQNDLVSAPSATHNWLQKLDWSGNEYFTDASFEPFKSSYWKPDTAACYGTAGYVKSYGLLRVFNVFGIGHRIFKETYLIDNSITKVFDLATERLSKEDYYDYYDLESDTTTESETTEKQRDKTTEEQRDTTTEEQRDTTTEEQRDITTVKQSDTITEKQRDSTAEKHNTTIVLNPTMELPVSEKVAGHSKPDVSNRSYNRYIGPVVDIDEPNNPHYGFDSSSGGRIGHGLFHLCTHSRFRNHTICLRSLGEAEVTDKPTSTPSEESLYPEVVAVPLNTSNSFLDFFANVPRVP